MATTQTKLRFRCKKRASVDFCKENNPSLSKKNDKDFSPSPLKQSENLLRSPGKRIQLQNDEEKGSVSPPKRDKVSDSENSPSQCLTKLHIDDGNPEEHLAPRRLFEKGHCFRSARLALHGSIPSTMPGRETEIEELRKFLIENKEKSSSGSLYISGPPGTGKTASLTSILQGAEFQDCRSIYVNCTSMKSSGCIYSRVCEELKLKVSSKGEKEYLQILNKFWDSSNKNKKTTILILDEIDQLESKRQTVLYTIFEWPSKLNSKLLLISIANVLDLTDRLLPRLQAHLSLKPKLLRFAPYTKQQIVQILTERLKEIDVVDVFSPAALQLLAGKVASVSGDVRRALDIGRRVLELAEAQKLSQMTPLQPTNCEHSGTFWPVALHTQLLQQLPMRSPIVSNTSSPKKKSGESVDLKIVMEVLNGVYGTSQTLCKSGNLTTNSEDGFPLQQKVLVCTLLLVLKNGKNKDVSVGKLHEIYRRVCKKRNLVAVSQAEFVSVCQLVETKGILQLQTKKETRLAKVRLLWDEEDVAAALKDKTLLSGILGDATVL